MYKARQYLNKSSLVNLYYSYPYLIYCIEIWGCAYCGFFCPKKLFVSIITFSHYLVHTEPLLGYEPADLTVHPPPKKNLSRVGLFFSYRCLVFPKKCPQRKACAFRSY